MNYIFSDPLVFLYGFKHMSMSCYLKSSHSLTSIAYVVATVFVCNLRWFSFLGNGSSWRAEPSTARIVFAICNGELALYTFKFFPLISLLFWLVSALASAKPAWLNFGQHRGTTYSYNNGSKKRQNWWARFTISILGTLIIRVIIRINQDDGSCDKYIFLV